MSAAQRLRSRSVFATTGVHMAVGVEDHMGPVVMTQGIPRVTFAGQTQTPESDS